MSNQDIEPERGRRSVESDLAELRVLLRTINRDELQRLTLPHWPPEQLPDGVVFDTEVETERDVSGLSMTFSIGISDDEDSVTTSTESEVLVEAMSFRDLGWGLVDPGLFDSYKEAASSYEESVDREFEQ